MRATFDTHSSTAAAWDVLDRFGLALSQCEQSAEQIHLALESVQEALGADAVGWFPGSTTEAPQTVGTPVIPAAWVRDFLRHALGNEEPASGQMVCNFLDPAAKPVAPWPFSAALVRVSRSRNSWLVALSFHPRRLFQPADLKVMVLARRMLLNHREQLVSAEKLKESLFGLVQCLSAAIDAKDPYTWGHSERVARIAVRLGKEMALPPGTVSELYLAGLLHDIGKIGVRDSVLQKEGALTEEEFTHVQEHAVIGDRLVSSVRALHHLRPGVRNHHERWDGEGYPDRLAGEDIPLLARILAVADSCDAMMNARSYRPALPTREIDAVLTEGAGTQWDPTVVEHFLRCRHDLYSICQRGLGDSVVAAVERALRAVTPHDEYWGRGR